MDLVNQDGEIVTIKMSREDFFILEDIVHAASISFSALDDQILDSSEEQVSDMEDKLRVIFDTLVDSRRK